MATDVIMPQMGFDMREGTVISWLKAEGEKIERGEAIAEIETDKATVELEAFTQGTLGRIYVEAGLTVPVGDVIAVITAAGETAPARPTETAAAPATPAVPAAGTGEINAGAAVATPSPAQTSDGRQVPVTPVAKRIAQEAEVDLDEIRANVLGKGPNGRVLRADVEAYLSNRNQAPPVTAPTTGATAQPPVFELGQPGVVVPDGLSPMRQAIARRMSISKLTAPHYYVTVEADMTRAQALRLQLNEELPDGERISVNDLIIRAVARTLADHPHFNVTVLPQGLQPNSGIPVSIAVAMDGGLLAPAVPDTGGMNIRELASATRDLIERARSNRLRPEEMSGIGFTVSNLGMYDVKGFVAIITPPNAGAIAVGSVKATPIVKDGEIAIGQMMSMTLSADHRATDGAQGAEFMNAVRHALEVPTALLL
ncbi:MAG: dihydrolipoamide acetyltransferase family protein [Dehalococcoidia bacterium]|jgi:pyruvate dehydrogenase E2 component (dihydrolipoamide acetyltransferase)|nr:dihydrolipoamide acetyltransferase family protein [Dehalococcoidia bacterium]